MSVSGDGEYTYEDSGFDKFLSREISGHQAANLDSPVPPSTQQAFDRTQATGALGDTLSIGRIRLNGSAGNIIINDGNNDFLLMGEE